MNTDAILFYSIVVIITTFCFRLVFINIKVRRYIKNIITMFGKGISGSLFMVVAALSDQIFFK